jgi:diaminopimelate epimerase
VRFEKWQALGNDYVIVERDSLPWELSAERITSICAPHFGVGSDGILLLSEPADGDAVAELRIFNPDGSEAELSGNGAREAALYLRRAGWTDADEFDIATAAGVVRPRITGPETVAMELGRAALRSDDYPNGPDDGTGELEVEGHRWSFQHVNVGNPQCVIDAGDEVEEVDLRRVGRRVETHELFPNRTNVSFWRADGPGAITARIFERGVGETMSSGTGASGAAVAYVLKGGESPVTVHLDGGDLEVEVGEDLQVILTGWARRVYAATLSDEFVEELNETE